MGKLEGVSAALTTPHTTAGCPDFAALHEHIEFAVSRGVHSLSIGGTTGEFVHFSVEQRIQMIDYAVRQSGVPVVAGVGHSTLEAAVRMAVAAVECGAVALLVMPPYYFHYSQDDIREFYVRFADRVPHTPILLYNIPAFTNAISPETMRDLLSCGRFAGIKDSSGSFEAFVRLKALRAHHPFQLLVGHEKIFTEARLQGADGIVSGVSAAVPELLVSIERAIQAGAQTRAQVLDRRLREFVAWLDRFPAPVGIRLAVAGRGLPIGPHAVPLSPAGQRVAEEFCGWFQQWLPATLEEAA